MIRCAMSSLLASGLLFAGLSVRAQESPQEEETKAVAAQQKPQKKETKAVLVLPSGPQLKVQIVFSEYEGNKRITNLPYTLLVPVTPNGGRNKIRIDDRISIPFGGGGFQYQNTGTDIDCGAKPASEGRYELAMTLDRNWVDMPAEAPADKSGTSQGDAHPGIVRPPTMRQFRVEHSVLLRDGQTIETTFATDPVSGNVIKLEVTLNVLK